MLIQNDFLKSWQAKNLPLFEPLRSPMAGPAQGDSL